MHKPELWCPKAKFDSLLENVPVSASFECLVRSSGVRYMFRPRLGGGGLTLKGGRPPTGRAYVQRPAVMQDPLSRLSRVDPQLQYDSVL